MSIEEIRNQFRLNLIKYRNVVAHLQPPHINLYDAPSLNIQQCETPIKKFLQNLVSKKEIEVWIFLGKGCPFDIVKDYSSEFEREINFIKLKVRDPLWIDANWRLFSSEELDFYHREIHFFIPYSDFYEFIKLWYAPSSLANPSVCASRKVISMIKKKIPSGVVCVSFMLLRLSNVVCFFASGDELRILDFLVEIKQTT